MARLLVVDKDESLCRILESTFREKGHLVETALSGQAAKKKIASLLFDVVISDVRVRGLTGIALLEYTRETGNPATFILMTAASSVSTAIRALDHGAYSYVVKTNKLVVELNLVVERVLEDLALRKKYSRLRSGHFHGSKAGIAATGLEAIQIPPEGVDFKSHISQVRKQYLQAALKAAGGVRRQAAALLRMSYRSYSRYAKKYGI